MKTKTPKIKAPKPTKKSLEDIYAELEQEVISLKTNKILPEDEKALIMLMAQRMFANQFGRKR